MPFDEIAYQKYFGRNPTKKVEKEKSRVFASEKSNTIHKKEIVTDKEYGQGMYRQVADDNIDDVEQLALLLKKLCNSAWGDDWGELSPDLKRGEDASKIILPQITVELNEKEQFFNDINDMTMASITNPTIESIIMEQANKILHNNLNPDEATKNAYKKLKIYLME